MNNEIKIFSGNANKPLANDICKHIGVSLGNCEIIKFSNDNIKVKILETVRGSDVYIIQPSCVPVNDGLMELLIMIDAVKHASAGRITAVCPYFPYARSDKKDEPRISCTARLVADLIETAGANRLMTMNLHSPQIQGFFRIPTDHLFAGKVLCDYFRDGDLSDTVIVAPDSGSAKLSGQYAEKLGLPLAVFDKRRKDDTESPCIGSMIGDVNGKNVIIFDDEVASAGSLIEVSKALKTHGAKDIKACCVHGVLSGKAVDRVQQSDISQLVVTDTVYIPEGKKVEKLKVVSVAKMFANVILNTNKGESISPLFDR